MFMYTAFPSHYIVHMQCKGHLSLCLLHFFIRGVACIRELPFDIYGERGAEDYPRSKLFSRHYGEANLSFKNQHNTHDFYKLLVRNKLFGGTKYRRLFLANSSAPPLHKYQMAAP